MSDESLKAKVAWYLKHGDTYRQKLLVNLQRQLPGLRALLDEADDHWGMEDGVYRFYHHSFKVYYLQGLTLKIVAVLQALLMDRPLNAWFNEIVAAGTGHTFQPEHNEDWLRHTRPIVEAAFHAHYFLRMACKYGAILEEPPQPMPSGWAALLYLYDLR